jgi:hypothetical protein
MAIFVFVSPDGHSQENHAVDTRTVLISGIVGYSEWTRYYVDETTERGFIITVDVGVLAEKEVIPEVLEYLT